MIGRSLPSACAFARILNSAVGDASGLIPGASFSQQPQQRLPALRGCGTTHLNRRFAAVTRTMLVESSPLTIAIRSGSS